MMEILEYVVIGLEILTSIALIIIILMQSGKESGLGAISGNSDSYMNKNGSGDLNKKLASATKWVAAAWILFTLILSLIK
ncbi:MAG: preprotein translocase subunit SecG [Ruminococcaceae bacterium]|nr:preprotein translocase subunit SecG [Oscillospiraceae bacterium]